MLLMEKGDDIERDSCEKENSEYPAGHPWNSGCFEASRYETEESKKAGAEIAVMVRTPGSSHVSSRKKKAPQ